TVTEIYEDCERKYSSSVAMMGDSDAERVLIDKPLVGRKEIEKFLNGLLSTLWENEDWQAVVPAFSDELKENIDRELGQPLVDIQFDKHLDTEKKREKIVSTLNEFVSARIFSRVFPGIEDGGIIDEPTYTTADGRSLLLEFAPTNLLTNMIAASAPLWSVKTHQIGSASQPITFVGLNGIQLPEKVIDELQRQIPEFRATDIVLCNNEPRVLVKQYDPLYSLASLENIIDYENYYRNSDRTLNPMHTDLKFATEPNPFLQWLSYESTRKVEIQSCSKGHDISDALRRGRQFCDYCSKNGIKNLIVPDKKLCPMCQHIIDKDSRKCPECGGIVENHKATGGQAVRLTGENADCPGCITMGRSQPEKMLVDPHSSGVKKFCPSCGSVWGCLCPYCAAVLEKPTVCTKGSDRCIFESPPILLCAGCSCPVTPDTVKCPRCFNDIEECQLCKAEERSIRMVPAHYQRCPNRHEFEQRTSSDERVERPAAVLGTESTRHHVVAEMRMHGEQSDNLVRRAQE
ncbi:MAG: hypothetical protein K2Z81_00030, partial [Cyanobacteria bacterium]|nr:hypothetical protein [Cyanobacteriota bacterium]